jgi:hypothetical protein
MLCPCSKSCYLRKNVKTVVINDFVVDSGFEVGNVTRIGIDKPDGVSVGEVETFCCCSASECNSSGVSVLFARMRAKSSPADPSYCYLKSSIPVLPPCDED